RAPGVEQPKNLQKPILRRKRLGRQIHGEDASRSCGVGGPTRERVRFSPRCLYRASGEENRGNSTPPAIARTARRGCRTCTQPVASVAGQHQVESGSHGVEISQNTTVISG